MPWLKIDDNFWAHPKVALAGNAAVGVFVRLLAHAAQYRTDGFITATPVTAVSATPQDLTKLVKAKLLHGRLNRCACRGGRPWPPEAIYLAHDFLVYNPSRFENDVARAQRRELRDPALREAVYERDRCMCRYCGVAVNRNDRKSASGGVLDHVDPTTAAGADNLVVACRGCNSRKQKRTPSQAAMTLLPPPGTIALPVADRTATRNRSATGSRSDPVPDPEHDTDHDTGLTRTGISHQTHSATTDVPGRGGQGRVPPAGDAGPAGRRPHLGPAPDPRRSAGPNPYLRRGHRDDHPPITGTES